MKDLKRGVRRWRTSLIYRKRIRQAERVAFLTPGPWLRSRKPFDCGRAHCRVCHLEKVDSLPTRFARLHAQDYQEQLEDYLLPQEGNQS